MESHAEATSHTIDRNSTPSKQITSPEIGTLSVPSSTTKVDTISRNPIKFGSRADIKESANVTSNNVETNSSEIEKFSQKHDRRIEIESVSTDRSFSKIDKDITLEKLNEQIRECHSCRLGSHRTQAVVGFGTKSAKVMFIGHSPGVADDSEGKPFVGKTGELLGNIIRAMKLTDDDVYITNVVKCLPIDGKLPHDEESHTCLPYLKKEIELINPRVIVLLGPIPLKILFNIEGLSTHRGEWMKLYNIDCIPTYHPLYLLRIPKAKREVWQDMQSVMQRIGIEP